MRIDVAAMIAEIHRGQRLSERWVNEFSEDIYAGSDNSDARALLEETLAWLESLK